MCCCTKCDLTFRTAIIRVHTAQAPSVLNDKNDNASNICFATASSLLSYGRSRLPPAPSSFRQKGKRQRDLRRHTKHTRSKFVRVCVRMWLWLCKTCHRRLCGGTCVHLVRASVCAALSCCFVSGVSEMFTL